MFNFDRMTFVWLVCLTFNELFSNLFNVYSDTVLAFSCDKTEFTLHVDKVHVLFYTLHECSRTILKTYVSKSLIDYVILYCS